MNYIQGQRAEYWGKLEFCDQKFVASVVMPRDVFANERIAG